jgi:hypothetical protein
MKRTLLLSPLLFFLLSSCITGNVSKEVKEERFDYKIVFCSEKSCFEEIINLINSSRIDDCAFYNMNSQVVAALKNKKSRIVADGNSKIGVSIAKKRLNGLMHNKFCVFDGKTVLTGSFNPTKNKKSFDNVIIINSSYLAQNYKDEFEELWQGSFGGGKKTRYTKIMMNTTLVENYFCPEDSCAERVKAAIKRADKSIYFMSYAFTLKELAGELLRKKEAGVRVEGVMENTGKYSVYELLNEINVKKHGRGLMHHKVFIIDNRTVITGSFNPTKNGNERNDENMIIVHNAEVAEKYLNEFSRLTG